MTTFASLFSGVLGWDLGAEAAGFTPLWTCEILPFARKVIAKHFAVRCYEDVRRLHARGACLRLAERGNQEQGGGSECAGQRTQQVTDGGCPDCADRPDILLASPPCQDLSVAGKRSGLAGARSGLFFDFARLAGELRPSWILMEQVPGLLSSNDGRDFGAVIETLDDLGYGLSWRVLDSRHFGVPQRRRRVYLVGHLGGSCPAEILFESEGSTGDSQASGAQGQDPAADTGSSVAGALGSRRRQDLDGHGAARTLRARPNASHREDTDTYVPTLAYAVAVPSSHGINVREGANNLVSHSLTANGCDASEDGTGRGTPMVAYPLRSGAQIADSNGNQGNVVEAATAGVRRLTPTECARLQGFPDRWTCLCDQTVCVCPDGPQYAAYGNAVTVNTVSWILRNLARVVRKSGVTSGPRPSTQST